MPDSERTTAARLLAERAGWKGDAADLASIEDFAAVATTALKLALSKPEPQVGWITETVDALHLLHGSPLGPLHVSPPVQRGSVVTLSPHAPMSEAARARASMLAKDAIAHACGHDEFALVVLDPPPSSPELNL